MANVSIFKKPELARCPRCQHFIDPSQRECPHCRAFLTADELRSATALQREITRRKARANNARATAYGALTILGFLAVVLVRISVDIGFGGSQRLSDVVEILGHIWRIFLNNMLPFVALFIVVPLIVVVVMRWQGRDN